MTRLAALAPRARRLVIVTASPDMVVAPFARGLGPRRCWAPSWPSTSGPGDRRLRLARTAAAAEKVRRLRATFGADVRLAAAYGDTAGDRDAGDRRGAGLPGLHGPPQDLTAMKHGSPATLDALEPLLAELRGVPG